LGSGDVSFQELYPVIIIRSEVQTLGHMMDENYISDESEGEAGE
jgi:hypothetical protein